MTPTAPKCPHLGTIPSIGNETAWPPGVRIDGPYPGRRAIDARSIAHDADDRRANDDAATNRTAMMTMNTVTTTAIRTQRLSRVAVVVAEIADLARRSGTGAVVGTTVLDRVERVGFAELHAAGRRRLHEHEQTEEHCCE